MERIKVNSSNIASIGYLLGVLEVEFKDKSIYQYLNVPELVFDKMAKASSKGKFLKDHIEKRFIPKKIK